MVTRMDQMNKRKNDTDINMTIVQQNFFFFKQTSGMKDPPQRWSSCRKGSMFSAKQGHPVHWSQQSDWLKGQGAAGCGEVPAPGCAGCSCCANWWTEDGGRGGHLAYSGFQSQSNSVLESPGWSCPFHQTPCCNCIGGLFPVLWYTAGNGMQFLAQHLIVHHTVYYIFWEKYYTKQI